MSASITVTVADLKDGKRRAELAQLAMQAEHAQAVADAISALETDISDDGVGMATAGGGVGGKGGAAGKAGKRGKGASGGGGAGANDTSSPSISALLTHEDADTREMAVRAMVGMEEFAVSSQASGLQP